MYERAWVGLWALPSGHNTHYAHYAPLQARGGQTPAGTRPTQRRRLFSDEETAVLATLRRVNRDSDEYSETGDSDMILSPSPTPVPPCHHQ